MKKVVLRSACLFLTVLSCVPAFGELITFSNSNPIAIPARGLANPYPSTIDVTGVTGPFQNFTLTLDGLSHTYPDDLGALVVSPSGTAVLLFSGPGTGVRASNLTFVFDDNAAETLPEEVVLTSGTYKPGLFQYDDVFPLPGPGPAPTSTPEVFVPNYGFTFQPFLTENPNGAWNLFVMDSNDGDAGAINRGWSISFSFGQVPEPSSFLLSTLALGGVLFRKRSRV